MATNTYANKIIYGNTTLIDLTADTITGSSVLNGTKFHLATGELVETASSASPASGTDPRKVVGISSKTSQTYHPTTTDQTITSGVYLSGTQTFKAVTVENLSAANVKTGVQINVGDSDDADRVATVTGTFTSDANATASELLSGVVAYVKGSKVTGTMANNGAVTGTISTVAGQYTVPIGFHDGSGKVSIDATEQAKIIAGNIKAGVTMLGVLGTYSGEAIAAQTKTVDAYTTASVITPDTGYDYLAQVNINAISYVETDNSAGGKTVTIGLVQ